MGCSKGIRETLEVYLSYREYNASLMQRIEVKNGDFATTECENNSKSKGKCSALPTYSKFTLITLNKALIAASISSKRNQKSNGRGQLPMEHLEI